MHALTTRHGGTKIQPQIPAAESRSLTRFAMENAREGCVRETYGALMACWQAKHAADPKIREAMAAIAHDETEHAALSWDIARFIESKLDDKNRALVHASQEDARRELAEALAAPVDATLVAVAGLPTPVEGKRLLDGLTLGLLAA